MRRAAPLALAIGLSSSGCAYFNAMWTAERFAKDARQLEQSGQVAEARSQWAQAAEKAELVVLRHPRSRWADDALTLQAEGLARSGSCEMAAAVVARVRQSVQDRALLERANLADAQCALVAKQPTRAEAALVLPLGSTDDARRSRAAYLAGEAAALRSDYDAAVQHLERSKEAAARPARIRALLGAGRTTEAAAALDDLTHPQFEADRADLLARLASAAEPEAASKTLDRLLARSRRLPFQEQARLLNADADRRFTHGALDEAAARYRRAALVAAVGSSEAGVALTGQQRVLIAKARHRDDLTPIEAELTRLSREPGGEPAKRLLEFLRPPRNEVRSPGAALRAAEVARDSLAARALAGQLFLDFAARDSGSLFAPKALIAAIPLLPDRRDSIVTVLDTRYAESPYTRVFHGAASVAYAAAEDSLARELGVEVARGMTATGTRVGSPRPGRRGPPLDDVPPPVESRPAMRRAPVRDRPTLPDRP